jgi:gamma-glutamyltranspeptidase/glutathione hydrolase
MGGYMQPQAHVQVLMNCIDFKLNPQAALDAPRWQWTGDNDILLESGFPGDIAEKLAELGHNISVTSDIGTFGRGQIIWNENGVLAGGCEPRADSAVVGW